MYFHVWSTLHLRTNLTSQLKAMRSGATILINGQTNNLLEFYFHGQSKPLLFISSDT